MTAKIRPVVTVFIALSFFVDRCQSQGTTTFTFEGAPPGTEQQYGVYSESGMNFAMAFGPGSVYLNGGGIAGYPSNGTGFLETPDGIPGGNGNTRFQFEFSSLTPFNLVSFDAARYAAFANPTIEVVGYKSQIMGPVISVTNIFTVTGPNFQTFFLDSSFNNVFQVDVFNARWSLDNLVVSGVPEPSPAALVVLGAVCVASFQRGRNPRKGRATSPDTKRLTVT